MPIRMRNRPSLVSLAVACLMLAATAAGVRAQTPPKPHHPGQWTSPAPWPNRDFTDGNSVQAIHMALVRGDTLFARPHSEVLAWEHWTPQANHQRSGGVWGWRLLTDDASQAHSNLTHIAIPAPPPYDLYCGGHTALPNGDLLIMSGTERGKTGENKSARFSAMNRTWMASDMNSRRWYGNATALGNGKVLATAGNRGHHMVVFGGQSKSGSDPAVLTNDVRRYAIIDGGQWDPAVTDPTPGSGTDWPDEREFATLAETKDGPHFLFGGKRGSVTLRDVWQLRRQDSDLAETYGWRQLAPVDPPTGPPPTRWRHVAAVDVGAQGTQDTVMYIHGGITNESGPTTVLPDFWKLEWNAAAQEWRWSDLTGIATGLPAARAGHTAMWDRKSRRMFMFGGEDASGNIINNSNFYVISFPGGVPTCQVATPAGPDGIPSPRTRHAMAANNRDEASPSDGVLFGGHKLNGTTPELTNELWTFTVSTTGPLLATWDRRDEGGAPPPRADASIIVYTETPTSYHVVGGELASGAWDPDVWEYRYDPPVRWERLPLPAAAFRGHRAVPEAEILTELRPEIYDPATNLWTAFGDPKKRQSYHMIFHASDGQLYSPGPNLAGTDLTWRFAPTSGAWSLYPTTTSRILDGTVGGILYRPDQIMKCGGGGIHESQGDANSLPTGLSTTPVPWRRTENRMARPRLDHTLNMLPTGQVIATGGLQFGDDNDDDTEDALPRKRPEIWDPTYDDPAQPGIGYWYGDTLLPPGEGEQLAAEGVTRGHHSSSVILPDGRILSGGGWDKHPANVRRSVDQYSPPYLFQPSAQGGAAAVRVRLTDGAVIAVVGATN